MKRAAWAFAAIVGAMGWLAVLDPWLATPAEASSSRTVLRRHLGAVGQPDRATTTSAPASQAGGVGDRTAKARRVAGPLVFVTAVGLFLVLVALAVWVIHWGRRLRQPGGRAGASPRGGRGNERKSDDPWTVAGQRLPTPPDEPDADDANDATGEQP